MSASLSMLGFLDFASFSGLTSRNTFALPGNYTRRGPDAEDLADGDEDRAFARRILNAMVAAIPNGRIREYEPGEGPKEWANPPTNTIIPTGTYTDRPDRLGNEGHEPKSRACLAEVEFITNQDIEENLVSGPNATGNRRNLASAIARSIFEDLRLRE